jgi:hypothetical protein
MSNETLLSLTGALIVVLVAILIYRWMEQTADLRLSLFRPYRGDPWPQGVQEEDEVHWQWTEPAVAAASTADQTTTPRDTDTAVATARLERVRVRGGPHPGDDAGLS